MRELRVYISDCRVAEQYLVRNLANLGDYAKPLHVGGAGFGCTLTHQP